VGAIGGDHLNGQNGITVRVPGNHRATSDLTTENQIRDVPSIIAGTSLLFCGVAIDPGPRGLTWAASVLSEQLWRNTRTSAAAARWLSVAVASPTGSRSSVGEDRPSSGDDPWRPADHQARQLAVSLVGRTE
jgi:hypothetical protein